MQHEVVYPKETWEWFGTPGHLCVGRWCRYHMATKIGPWIVSTVGMYVTPMDIAKGGEQANKPTKIGWNRLLETMVFRAIECTCGGELCEGWAIEPSEIDMAPANTASEARSNHMQLCDKWSRVAGEGDN